jgi:hypothetical protein
MRHVCWMVLMTLLLAMETQVSAQPRNENSYEMVTTQQDQNISFGARSQQHQHYPGWRSRMDKVVILDKRTGELWAWSEALQTVTYLGQIFPLTDTGTIAHIIQVNPEQKSP